MKFPSDAPVHLSKNLNPEDQAKFEMAERMACGTIRFDKVVTLKQQLATRGFLTRTQWAFIRSCMITDKE